MGHSSFEMTCPASVYKQRRTRLASSLTRPAVFFAGVARPIHYPANTVPFRAGSHYLYFGGPPIEGAAIVIEPGSDGDAGCALVRSVPTIDDIVWIGSVADDAELSALSGISASRFVEPDHLPRFLAKRAAATFHPPCMTTRDWVASLQLPAPTPDEAFAVVNLRLVKDEHEQKALRRAAAITVEGHKALIAAARPGAAEFELEAALQSVFFRHRAQPSFTPIVTVRGEVLHTRAGATRVKSGDMILADAAAEEPSGYAGDVTRVYPIGGKFSATRRRFYDVVLRAQRSAVDASISGARFRDVHDLCAKAMCEGLVDAGLLRGRADDLAARRAHTLFFTHGLGHLIGLDVHDMEDLGDQAGYAPGRTRRPGFGDKFLRLDRDLASGFALTIEPGFYIVPAIWRHEAMVAPFKDVVNAEMVRELIDSRFGGIRIEDAIIVRDRGGPEVLTAGLPKDASEIERLMPA